MGCYLSKNLRGHSNSHIFRVYNVNNLGAEISPGKIEVTELDLIFYQKNKEPIKWPLWCLRRYGFDEELFSFESGRRCTTGSGIYAFKCHQAEELFNLVQQAIQNVGQLEHLRSSEALTNGTQGIDHPHSRPLSLVNPLEPMGMHLSSTGHVAIVPSDHHLYMNSSVILKEDGFPNYVNTQSSRPISIQTAPKDDASALIDFLHDPPMAMASPPLNLLTFNYAKPDLPKSTENIFEASNEVIEGAAGEITDLRPSCAESYGKNGLDEVTLNSGDLDVFSDEIFHPNYINVGAESKIIASKTDQCTLDNNGKSLDVISKNLLLRRLSIEQNYSNIGAASFNIPDPNRVTMNPANSSINATNRLSIPVKLNYIEIDVNKTDSDSVAGAGNSAVLTVPDSPSKHTESYAMIDFNRTFALSNSARPSNNNEEGLRKTRHNSTII